MERGWGGIRHMAIVSWAAVVKDGRVSISREKKD
jgi:hypothetical protein